MTELPPGVARQLRILEASLRRSEANRVKLEEQRDFNDALHRRVIQQMLETELRLRESEQRANAASHAKSEFLANMSHEIRTPLTGVIGLAELLSATSLDRRQQELVGNLSRAASVLARLIDDVLDFSRIEAGKLQLEETEFDPSIPLREAIDLIAERAAGQGLALAYDPPPPCLVLGDAFRLRQVLINLLGNSLKFTATGEIRVHAELVTRADGCNVVVEVADTGIGVQPDQVEVIFEAFRQADGSTTRRYGGSGLGLAISREIVRAMGGTLTAAPRSGGGSVFTLVLPATATVPGASAVASSQAVPASRGIPSIAGCRILVAEDNLVNSEVIASMLRDAGAIVVRAIDGEQAVAALGREPFDLAFIDLHMPGYDGLTVARFARSAAAETTGLAGSRNPTTPLVALTAAVLRTDRERCVEAGMCDFVAKPFTRASLGAALDRWCRPRVNGAIDRAVLGELAEWIDDAALDRAVARFGTTTEQAVAAIVSAVADGAASRVGDLAHATKSSAGQLGARELAGQLEQIERGAREGRLPSADAVAMCRQAACDAVAELPRAVAATRR